MKFSIISIISILIFSFNSKVVNGQTTHPILIGMDSDNSTYPGRWGSLVYIEAFKRMKIPLIIDVYPLKRLEELAKDELIDGEAARIYEYGNTHKHLVRVEEPLFYYNFDLYSARPKMGLYKLADIKQKNYSVEYRRGIKICEKTLSQFSPQDNLQTAATSEQGIKKLLKHRMDLFCDTDLNILSALHTTQFNINEIKQIHKAFTIKANFPIYPYLLKRHSALALKLAGTLKQMRAEGLIEKFRLDVERQFGWSK